MESERPLPMPTDQRGDPAIDWLLKLQSSLEPATVAQTIQAVLFESLGATRTRVFTFLEDDHARVVLFGESENQKPIIAASLDGILVVGKRVVGPQVAGSTGAEGPWRALVPLSADGDAVGILEISFDRALSAADFARLELLGRTVSLTVRNAETFEKTRRLTFTDHLTALYNSRFMTLYLERELKRCRRNRSSLTLLFMDLDGFKGVNDKHGHLAGSKTLIEVGAVLERTVRDADVLIRYGGDEFVVLFPETPLAGGLVIAERIRQVIGMTKFLESQKIDARISASIGIAAYPESADDVRSLIASADQAMYRAKALGKNRVVSASPLSSPNL